MLIGNTCIKGGGDDLKNLSIFIRYNGKTYDFSSKISHNIELNSVNCTFLLTWTRILQNSSKISEKKLGS